MKTFSNYMNSWLYDNDGYYANYKIIGKEGDFFTSVSTTSFFGGTIAKKIVDSIEEKSLSKTCSIVEIGAHHGYLLADIIQFIYTLKPALLNSLNFIIIEKFESLTKKQKSYLYESFGDAINLTFYKDLSEVKLNEAFIVANEIFDAFTCELVYTKDNILHQAFVKENTILFHPCKDKNILNYCKKFNITKGEVALSYKSFIETLNKNIEKFIFITFDYGDNYARNDFSIRVYKNHKVYAFFDKSINVLQFYKNSDITYDVNFKYLIDIAHKLSLQTNFKTQAMALIDFGIVELLELLRKNVDENNYLKQTQKVKLLIEPTGMGDRFKMLEIRKLK